MLINIFVSLLYSCDCRSNCISCFKNAVMWRQCLSNV